MKVKLIKKTICYLSASSFLFIFGCKGSYQKTDLTCESPESSISDSVTVEYTELQRYNWDANAYNSITAIIAQYGIKSPNYAAAKKPYAVFDWDNTSVINDVEENLFRYQLQNLIFKMTPEEFYAVITKDIPETPFISEFNKRDGTPLNISMLSYDIIRDYEFLYSNYKGLKGSLPLNEIKKTPQYKDFNVKMIYLYYAISESFSHDVSYPWALYLFKGMNKSEVQAIAEKSIDCALQEPLETVREMSPQELKGKSGVVAISYKTGLRTIREIQNLFYTLRKNGFDVYVCSASFIDVVQVFASNEKYGYNLPPENIIGMELERESSGIITDSYRQGYVQSQSEGKTQNIKRFLVSKYGYGPLIVAGDSSGDYAMMSDFPDTKLVILIDRNQTGKIGDFRNKALNSEEYNNRKIVLQGRDETKGVFIPQKKSIFLKQ